MTIPKLTLPDDYLKAIGSVVVSWNQLEIVMVVSLLNLLRHDLKKVESHLIFPHIAFNQRIDIIAAVIRATKDPSDPLVTRFEKWVLPQLRNMQTKRNDVIHSLWTTESDGGVTTSQIAARGRLKLKTDKPSVAELEGLADEIVQATNNLHDLIAGFIGVESLST